MRSSYYQWALIVLSTIVCALLGIFIYREVFPEYRIYQNAYIALEAFRSSYTGEEPPVFKEGIKQIVIPSETKGPETVDRCISCHVALNLPHFSPTRPEKDINGNIVRDSYGRVRQVPNEEYIFARLDAQIKELEDPSVNQRLSLEGEERVVRTREARARLLKGLKTVQVGEHCYALSKVLIAHPLLGAETRPFELHSMDEIGCVSCHNGNGRGLVSDRAHGPVWDGQYEVEEHGPKPSFTESDPQHDPLFSHIFNAKPSQRLLFHTTPLFVGGLIEAKCAECHQSDHQQSLSTLNNLDGTVKNSQELAALNSSFNEDIRSLNALIQLKREIMQEGIEKTLQRVRSSLGQYLITEEERQALLSHSQFIAAYVPHDQRQCLSFIEERLTELLGNKECITAWETKAPCDISLYNPEGLSQYKTQLEIFLNNLLNKSSFSGRLLVKQKAILAKKKGLNLLDDTYSNTAYMPNQKESITAIPSKLDGLMPHYQRGKRLFTSQGCYACHRIAGYSRGGVGPELTKEGFSYPWFVKESIVWPQADLPSSTMPNFKMDHEEVEDLLTYLMAQKGKGKAVSDVDYAISLKSWEAGFKMPWEKEVPADYVQNVHYGMKVFAKEGCASCHRLHGFTSEVGYAIESKSNLEKLFNEKDWFRAIFPEDIQGSQVIASVLRHYDEINTRIRHDVHPRGILDELEEEDPGLIKTYYQPFAFALRGKPEKRGDCPLDEASWHNIINKVLKMFIQEYGLGRQIAPRLSWSGIYRTDEWMLEHFKNPSSHVPRSLMPVMPFDDTKFYALTNMLNILCEENRQSVRQRWTIQGFKPEEAFQIHCAVCHGNSLHGNGPASEWIYPIPKNLRNATFLRGLTRKKAKESIMYGVQGTPMPPWGSVVQKGHYSHAEPVLKENEIEQMLDWLFDSLSGDKVISSNQYISKWNYSPENVLSELKQEEKSLNALKKGVENTHSESYEVQSHQEEKVSTYFDVIADPTYTDGVRYKIKKEFYSLENLREGEQFFLVNCAHCHGKEGGGNGERAVTMDEAKPRMLTNWDWLESKDDLRLLRSIKYGVPGTAMTPWGDLTSSLQRMQLVMFIRSLSMEKSIREKLSTLVYKAVEQEEILIESNRAPIQKHIHLLHNKLVAVREQRKNLESSVKLEENKAQETVQAYQQEIDLEQQESQLRKKDLLLVRIKASLEKEKRSLDAISSMLISRGASEQTIHDYSTLLQSFCGRFVEADCYVKWAWDMHFQQQLSEIIQKMQGNMQKEIEEEDHKKRSIEGMLPSIEKHNLMQQISERKDNLEKIRLAVFAALEAVFIGHQEQKQDIEAYFNTP